jgi:hypothetical protein
MATIQRPTKEGSVRTYQEKVGLGFVDILASEMDADLDTIYAAWNGGADTVNLKDGSVTTAKLATGAVRGTPSAGGTLREIQKASIWGGDDLIDLSIPTAKYANLSITNAKLAAGAPVASTQAASAGAQNFTTGTETRVVSLPGYVHRGGTVFVWVDSYGRNDGNLGDHNWQLRLYRGASMLTTRDVHYNNQTASQLLPLTWGFLFLDLALAAGTYEYDVNILRTAGTNAITMLSTNIFVWTL